MRCDCFGALYPINSNSLKRIIIIVIFSSSSSGSLCSMLFFARLLPLLCTIACFFGQTSSISITFFLSYFDIFERNPLWSNLKSIILAYKRDRFSPIELPLNEQQNKSFDAKATNKQMSKWFKLGGNSMWIWMNEHPWKHTFFPPVHLFADSFVLWHTNRAYIIVPLFVVFLLEKPSDSFRKI